MITRLVLRILAVSSALILWIVYGSSNVSTAFMFVLNILLFIDATGHDAVHSLWPEQKKQMDDINYMKKLHVAVDDICKNVITGKGDLHCCGVEKFLSVHDEAGHRVYVEETFPNDHEVQSIINYELDQMGFDGRIEVVTEW